jgi:hypothetical protein
MVAEGANFFFSKMASAPPFAFAWLGSHTNDFDAFTDDDNDNNDDGDGPGSV